MDKKHDLVESRTSIEQNVRIQPIPKKMRIFSLRRPSHPSPASNSTLHSSESASGNNGSTHVNASTGSTQAEPSTPSTSASSIQVVPSCASRKDPQQDVHCVRHFKSPETNSIPSKDPQHQSIPRGPGSEDPKERCLQEGNSLKIKISTVSSSTEIYKNLFRTSDEHGKEDMQETTRANDFTGGIHASSAALERTVEIVVGANSLPTCETEPNSINDPDCSEGLNETYEDDEIQDWDSDDFDADCEPYPVMAPVAENACPVCGIGLSSLGTMAPDAHVNRCLDGTINGPIAEASGHGVAGQTTPRNPLTSNIGTIHFTVDAFCYGVIEGCDAYFLSHFHSDHYGGLTSSWKHGLIYCSNITANLVISHLGVNSTYIKRLPMYEPVVVNDVTVRLMDANHCPGSVLFVFDLQNPQRRYLHTGDFRALPDMCLDPILCQPQNVPIDILYLDTTYSNSRYTFPPQDVVIREAVNLVCREVGIHNEQTVVAPVVKVAKKMNIMESWLRKESGNSEKLQSMSIKAAHSTKANQKWQEPGEGNKIVICVGTYLIGKERVFKAIAKAIKSKVFVQHSKLQILACLEDPELMEMLTSDRLEARVHLLHMGSEMSPESLQGYLDTLAPIFTRLIAIRPTGWTFTGTKKFTPVDNGSTHQIMTLEIIPSFTSPTIKIYPIPYSEHSSFNELAGFVRSLNIHKIIPTVGVGSEKNRQAMNEWFRQWQNERRQGWI
ncbi:DNA break repair nuclease [Modicella reniformis]|uniref:DNA break repair nuclease n=1 Tax=Modicella reniformis TaxID=1440133 RepID=A0A9P6IXH3_9FUNG|nr:DNA break repair nuclease [Modicella reniformis]